MSKAIHLLTWFITLLTVALVVFFVIPILPIPNTYKIVIVRSGSMEPTIATGSISVYTPGQEYQKDDVIVFKNRSVGNEKIATIHRIVEVEEKDGEKFYKTKGDNNQSEDPVATPKSDVMGKVAFSVPQIGYLISWGQTSTGFVVMVIIPLGLLAYHEVHSFLQKRKDKHTTVAAHTKENDHAN